MTSNHHIGIVLLAAGKAGRFGSAKQLLSIAGVPMVRHCALAAVDTGARVSVVTGAYRDQVEEQLSDLPVNLVFNPDWQLGIGNSIACGINAVSGMEPSIDAAIISLADQPMITAAELMRLICAHSRTGRRIIAATCNNISGPPCLFPRAYFGDLANLKGYRGARALLDFHSANVDGLPMAASMADIDTPEDYLRLRHS